MASRWPGQQGSTGHPSHQECAPPTAQGQGNHVQGPPDLCTAACQVGTTGHRAPSRQGQPLGTSLPLWATRSLALTSPGTPRSPR